ncbi:MAG: hypothetical protein IPL99_25490 [Candidatus Competibacteraceae bacterium]|nr:hypothetical protein [Candidatus Competibacteraceae bacterium]
MNQPSARSRIGPLEVRVAALENENHILRSENETLSAARDAATRCNDELTTVRSTAAQTLAIDEENRTAPPRHRGGAGTATAIRDRECGPARLVLSPLVPRRGRSRLWGSGVWSPPPASLLAAAAVAGGQL